MPTRNIERTAFHEAGHVVCYALLGLPFSGVILNGTGRMTGAYESSGKEVSIKIVGFSGVSRSAQDVEAFDNERKAGKLDIKEVICRMAGPIAESMLTGELDEEIKAAESREVSFPYFRLESDDVLGEFRKKTIALVKENWAAVERIAGELVKRKRLSYAEIVELISAMTGEKK